MSSAVCFSLDRSKILSSGNGLNDTPAKSIDQLQPAQSASAESGRKFIVFNFSAYHMVIHHHDSVVGATRWSQWIDVVRSMS